MTITRYVVQTGSPAGFDCGWKDKKEYSEIQDADWMANYLRLVKGKYTRVVKVETTVPE